MRRVTFRGAFVVAAVLAVAPALANAATIGGEVFGAVNKYNMSDINDAIDIANTNNAQTFDKLPNGVTGGISIRMWSSPNWMFSGTWEPLYVSTESTVPSSSKINLDANSFQATGAYFFPTKGHTNAKYGIGAGLGIYSVKGEDTYSVPNTTVDITGSGVGFHVLGLSEWTVNPGFSITAAAGFRSASVDIDNSATNQTADYSGFVGRLGMAFYMPKSK